MWRGARPIDVDSHFERTRGNRSRFGRCRRDSHLCVNASRTANSDLWFGAVFAGLLAIAGLVGAVMIFFRVPTQERYAKSWVAPWNQGSRWYDPND